MDPKEALREKWKLHVADWQSSGKSCKQWAKDKNLSYHSLLYWRQKHLGIRSVLPTSFVELSDPLPAASGIVLEIATVKIHVDKSFDPATLTECIKLLRNF
jgi:hypothetical protein